jgi:hypothetical protein
MPAPTYFLSVESFVNRYQLSVAFKNGTALIEQYIHLYEKKYLYQLFGKELADLFYDDDSVARFEDIKSEFTFEVEYNGCARSYFCTGLTDILSALVYVHYSREQLQISTSIGQIKPSVEAGSIANDNYTNTILLFNQAVKSSAILQRFLEHNKDIYPEYKGVELDSIWFA